MTALPRSSDWISPEDYIAGELRSEIRHEYIEGRVYAMAGASRDHNGIAGNLFSVLHAHLRGTTCEPFMNDMKVKIPPQFANIYYYPDVVVACEPTDNADHFSDQPAIIVEVLSPDTERTDRREKALAYRQIPTVEDYVLLEQEKMAATVMRRAEVGWNAEEMQSGKAVLRLEKIDFEVPLAVLYERTSLA